MTGALLWPLAVLAVWAAAWFVFLRPTLARVHRTMGVDLVLKDPRLSALRRALHWVEGAKTLLLSFAVSMFAVVKSCLDALAANTDVLDEVKRDFPWTLWFTPDRSLKIVSVMMLALAFLHAYGVLTAARTPPMN